MHLMWLDATWVGRESVPCPGCERWPLAGPVPFCEVWGWVVSAGSQLDSLMHSVIGVPYRVAHSPSSRFFFKFYGCPPIVSSLGSFLTYAGYCCPCKFGRFRGGVGHSEYPGAKLHFNNCLEEWFDELMVGQLDSVASGDAVQQLFQVFEVHFHGGDSTLISILTASGILRMLVRLCIGGLFLVCQAIGSLVQTRGDQFSFY
jgi:hypothetical protein